MELENYRLASLLLTAVFIFGTQGVAQSASKQTASANTAASNALSAPTILSATELETLTQSIALYPDILLQQMLAASTFPEQLIDAALYHEQGKDPKGVMSQPWDDSVKGIANYPSILTKMVTDLDWTISLGYAFINQSQDLLKAIQSLRAKAKALGNLKDSEQAKIIADSNAKGEQVIRIESTNPEVIYVPVTTQTVVYQESESSSAAWAPVATFGLGMALGYAMGDDDDDDHYHYGGYYGPGFWYNDDAVDNWQDHRQDRWDDYSDYQKDKQDWRQDSADDWREYRQDLGRQQQDWKTERQNQVKNMSPEQRAEAQTKAKNASGEWSQKSPEARQQALQSRGVDSSNVNQGKLGELKAQGKGSFSKASDIRSGSVDKEQASQRLNQAKSNPDFQKKATDFKSKQSAAGRSSTSGSSPQPRQRSAQSVSGSSYSPARDFSSRSGSSYSGGSLSGMGSSGSSVNRSQTRGATSRASTSSFSRGSGGGFSRGGGGGGRGGGRR